MSPGWFGRDSGTAKTVTSPPPDTSEIQNRRRIVDLEAEIHGIRLKIAQLADELQSQQERTRKGLESVRASLKPRDGGKFTSAPVNGQQTVEGDPSQLSHDDILKLAREQGHL